MSKLQPVNDFTPNYEIVEEDLSPHIQSATMNYSEDENPTILSHKVYNVNGFEFSFPYEEGRLTIQFDERDLASGRNDVSFQVSDLTVHEESIQWNAETHHFKETWDGIVDVIYRKANHPDMENNAYSNKLTPVQRMLAQNPEWIENHLHETLDRNEINIRSQILEDVVTEIQGTSNRVTIAESKESQSIINAAVKRVEGRVDTDVRGRRGYTCLDFVQCTLQDAGYTDFVAWDYKWNRHTASNVEAERFYKESPNWSVYYDIEQIQPGDHVVLGNRVPDNENAEDYAGLKHSVIVVDKTTQGYYIAHETGDKSIPEIKFVFPEYFYSEGVSSVNRLDIKDRNFVPNPSSDFHHGDPVSRENMLPEQGPNVFDVSAQSNIGNTIYDLLFLETENPTLEQTEE